MSDPRPSLHLPARDIPIPTSVSAEAQAVLAMPPMEKLEYPPLDDVDAWRAMIASYEETVGAILGDRVSNAPVKTQDRDFGDFAAYEITPLGLADDDRRVYLDIHGGGFINGGGESCRAMGIGTALRVGARVWTPDYPHAAGSSVPGGPR